MKFEMNRYLPLLNRVTYELRYLSLPFLELHHGPYCAVNGEAICSAGLNYADRGYTIEWQRRGAAYVIVWLYERGLYTKARL